MNNFVKRLAAACLAAVLALSAVEAKAAEVFKDPTTGEYINAAGMPDWRGSSTLSAATANAAVTVALDGARGVVGFAVSGLAASGAVLTAEATNNAGATWSPINTAAPGTGLLSATVSADGQFRVNAAGHTAVRLRVSTTGAGSVGIGFSVSSAPGLVALSAPLPPAGSSGVDRSFNAPAGPGTATSFTFNGTTLNLLGTIAANPNRRGIEINNTSGSLVVLVIDDGANTAGTVSLFPLSPGSQPYTQGGDMAPAAEQGRIRVFGATGAFTYGREN